MRLMVFGALRRLIGLIVIGGIALLVNRLSIGYWEAFVICAPEGIVLRAILNLNRRNSNGWITSRLPSVRHPA